jgi:hypothetical protein
MYSRRSAWSPKKLHTNGRIAILPRLRPGQGEAKGEEMIPTSKKEIITAIECAKSFCIAGEQFEAAARLAEIAKQVRSARIILAKKGKRK